MTTRYLCLCCGFLTLHEAPPGTYAICPVCWWEDDQVQGKDPDYAGGANEVSLRQAQDNCRRLGVSAPECKDNVRWPEADEVPGSSRD
jgi:hypothetical protein